MHELCCLGTDMLSEDTPNMRRLSIHSPVNNGEICCWKTSKQFPSRKPVQHFYVWDTSTLLFSYHTSLVINDPETQCGYRVCPNNNNTTVELRFVEYRQQQRWPGADSLVCQLSPSIEHNNIVSPSSLSQAEIVVLTLKWLNIL